MRKSSEIRAWIQQNLTGMLLRPGMYGVNQSYEILARMRLSDLAFIDDREKRLALRWKKLERDGYWSQLGMYGALASAVPSLDDYTDRLASIYARVASSMGYFEAARRVPQPEWEQWQREVVPWATAEPRGREDIRARFGEPSYCGSSQYAPVLAYAGPTDDAWLYFDLEHTGDRGDGLRYLRLPIRSLRRSLVDVVRPSRRFSLPDEDDSPESAYRRFLIAELFADESTLRELVLPDENNAFLWKSAYPEDVAVLLAEQHRTMAVLRVEAPPEPSRVYLRSSGCPVPLAVVKTSEGWKIEARPLADIRKEQLSS